MTKQAMTVKFSNILINYDDCVKCSDFFLFEMIIDHYRDSFKNFISVDLLDLMDTEPNFKLIYFSRTIYNPFQWMAITDFDYDGNYEYFHKKYKNMYIESYSLDLCQDIIEFTKSYMIKNIYIYSKEYDKRIDFDYQYTFNKNPKLQYVTGNLDDVIDKCSIEAVFYPVINDEILQLARKNKHVIFSIPNYGFNMQDPVTLKGITDTDENIGFYPIMKNAKPLFFG